MVYVYICIWNTYRNSCVYQDIEKFTHINICVYMYEWMCAFMYVYLCMYSYTNGMYIYTCTFVSHREICKVDV
jgi:hypothetical protein